MNLEEPAYGETLLALVQKALEAIKLLSETANDKGVDILDVLIADDVDPGGVFGMANIKTCGSRIGNSNRD